MAQRLGAPSAGESAAWGWRGARERPYDGFVYDDKGTRSEGPPIAVGPPRWPAVGGRGAAETGNGPAWCTRTKPMFTGEKERTPPCVDECAVQDGRNLGRVERSTRTEPRLQRQQTLLLAE